MSRKFRVLGSLLLGLAVALSLGACSQAYSDRSATAPAPMQLAGDPGAQSPYGVEILDESGNALATYQSGGRYYVLGETGGRYLIRVSNPTARRIEAVITVDGLDVIDGQEGDLRKRGYVVPAGGDLRVEGWRTSTSEVATFRFSSVGESYAGRKGKARNVGVIAVAIFDEVPPQEIILEQQPQSPVVEYDENSIRGYDPSPSGGNYDDDGDEAEADYGGGGSVHAKRSGGSAGADRPTTTGEGGRVMRPPPPPDDYRPPVDKDEEPPPDTGCCTQKSSRPGLGTEYGEQRYSAATWTRFVRSSESPVAIAELRYNDAAGLAALGIQVAPAVDSEELTKRETADPFPGDQGYAQPPR